MGRFEMGKGVFFGREKHFGVQAHSVEDSITQVKWRAEDILIEEPRQKRQKSRVVNFKEGVISKSNMHRDTIMMRTEKW
jgi:hypothetical protein